MNQTEPISQIGDRTLEMEEPLRVMPMEEAPTMEGRGNLRVFLVMMALAVLAPSLLARRLLLTILARAVLLRPG